MSEYYPHATGVLGYKSPRPQIGDRPTWAQRFKNNGYDTARVSKIFHMGVPGEIETVQMVLMVHCLGLNDLIVQGSNGKPLALEKL